MEEIARPKEIGDNIAMTALQVIGSAVLIVCALQTALDKPFIGGAMAIMVAVTLWHGFATRALDKLACSVHLTALYINALSLRRDPGLDQLTPRKVNLLAGFASCTISTLCNGALMAMMTTQTHLEQTGDIRAYTMHACIAGSVIYWLYLACWYTVAWRTVTSETRRMNNAARDD